MASLGNLAGKVALITGIARWQLILLTLNDSLKSMFYENRTVLWYIYTIFFTARYLLLSSILGSHCITVYVVNCFLHWGKNSPLENEFLFCVNLVQKLTFHCIKPFYMTQPYSNYQLGIGRGSCIIITGIFPLKAGTFNLELVFEIDTKAWALVFIK